MTRTLLVGTLASALVGAAVGACVGALVFVGIVGRSMAPRGKHG